MSFSRTGISDAKPITLSFVKHYRGKVTTLIVYVDDIVVIENDQ